jgi:type IV secretory pathway TrbF-like protein
MRRWPIVGLLAVPLTLSSCSGVTGSKPSSPSRPSACTYVAKLDDIADSVARADVRDPDAFKKTFATAVSQYVTNVRELRAVAPPDLQDDLDRVEADVQQFRFDAARTDRAGLDAYADRTCGRAVGTSTTTSGPAGATRSTTSPSSGG